MDELFTRCPTCLTVFRTHEDQLAVQSGKVRCGHCRMVFDGRAHLVDLRPQAAQDFDEAAIGPPTVTLRTAIDLQPAGERELDGGVPEPAGLAERAVPAATIESPASAGPTRPTGPASRVELAAPGEASDKSVDHGGAGAVPPVEDVTPYHWQAASRAADRRARWIYGGLALVLSLALCAQGVFHFRNAIAAQQPELRPHLVSACALIGCSIEPTRNREEITIESHDLQADPAHQGLLILQTTIRNRAAHPVAFPHLELELDDLGGQPVVRKVFAPVEYAGGAADFAVGIPAGGEWNVKLFLDASTVSAGGYNLYLFYP